jgi:glycosyltransferase involved in cell wall biosynthesis
MNNTKNRRHNEMELEARISVIIVTYNRPDEAKKAIKSLLNQSVKPFEIIVIDDASSTPLQMKIEDSRIKLIRFNEERGLSGARNCGISESIGDYLAFIDDDCIATKHWLEEIQKGIKAGGDILGGPLRPMLRTKPPVWWDEYDLGYFAGVGNSKNHAIWGANMIFRKEVFKKIGVFNPKIGRQKGKLLAHEDAYLISKGRENYKVLFMPKAVVYHLVRAERLTLRYIIRWSYYAGKSQKIASGPNKLAIYFFLKILMELVNPFSSTKKSAKIEKIARLAELFGAVF